MCWYSVPVRLPFLQPLLVVSFVDSSWVSKSADAAVVQPSVEMLGRSPG